MYDEVMNIWKSLRELWNGELYERRSQLHLYIDTTFAVAKKESLTKIQACKGFEPLPSTIPVERSYWLS